MLNTISESVLALGADLGGFIIPVAIAVAIALVLFARNSYKLFRFALPVFAALAGAYIGAGLLGKPLATAVPALANVVNPYYLVGGVVGIVLGLLCAKLHKPVMFVVGAGLGYLVVGELAKTAILKLQITKDIIDATDTFMHRAVGVAICVICLIVCAIILLKFFKPIYIVVSSVGGVIVAFSVLAIFAFAGTSIAPYALLAAAALGLLVGIRTAVDQFESII